MHSAPTGTKKLGTIDKTGAYFQKTLGVLPHLSEEHKRCATIHTARHSQGKGDFLYLADALGLLGVVDVMAGEGWRHAS